MNTKRQFLLGVFFLAALSLLAFYTLFLTDFTLFSKPEQETVYFPRAHGLRVGDPVLVAGLRVGRVGELEYDIAAEKSKRIRAVLNLDLQVDILEGYVIQIQESTMLGGRHVEIDPGLYGGPLAPRDAEGALRGTVQANPFAALSSIGEFVAENGDTARSILDNFEAIVANARDGQGPVGRLLNDEELAAGLTESVANFREVSAGVKQMTDDVNAGKGLIGALIHDEEIVANVKATIDDLKTIGDDLKAGKGTIGRLMYDDPLADEVEEAIRGLSDLVTGLESGNGLLGRLLTDEEMAANAFAMIEDFRNTGADIREVAATLRAGDGSLGKLMMSEELYEEALVAVKLVTRSLEDYREAAPITAFTSVLFAGF